MNRDVDSMYFQPNMGVLGRIFAFTVLFVSTSVVASIAGEKEDKTAEQKKSSEEGEIYTYLQKPSRDGIGKVYQGREISHVMGHLGAPWLERISREAEEKPSVLIKNMGLKPGMNIADIGAGSGYFTRRIAPIVGPKGKVYAVDIQQEMLDILLGKLKKKDINNVIPVLGKINDPKLPPESVDLAFMVDVYHEFSHPYEMMKGIKKALKPGGLVVWIEYRKEDPLVRIKPLHKMSKDQVKREALFVGLEFDHSFNDLPQQHVLFYRKPAKKNGGK